MGRRRRRSNRTRRPLRESARPTDRHHTKRGGPPRGKNTLPVTELSSSFRTIAQRSAPTSLLARMSAPSGVTCSPDWPKLGEATEAPPTSASSESRRRLVMAASRSWSRRRSGQHVWGAWCQPHRGQSRWRIARPACSRRRTTDPPGYEGAPHPLPRLPVLLMARTPTSLRRGLKVAIAARVVTAGWSGHASPVAAREHARSRRSSGRRDRRGRSQADRPARERRPRRAERP